MTVPFVGLDEIVSMTWRASKLRKVGLHEMVWGLGGRNALQVDRVQGRGGVSLASDQTPICLA